MMKRFLYIAAVEHCEGSQTFYIDADTSAEADKRAAAGESDGIYAHDVDVDALSDMEACGETTTDDFGDFPPYDPSVMTDAVKAAMLDVLLSDLRFVVYFTGETHAKPLGPKRLHKTLLQLLSEKDNA